MKIVSQEDPKCDKPFLLKVMERFLHTSQLCTQKYIEPLNRNLYISYVFIVGT